MTVRARLLEYDVAVDREGGLSMPGGALIPQAEGWTADHLLLAALVRCSIESFSHHARRAGHAVTASGRAHGEVTRRESDGRYALVRASVRIQVELTPPADDPASLTAKAERDCFVGASLTIEPDYDWSVT